MTRPRSVRTGLLRVVLLVIAAVLFAPSCGTPTLAERGAVLARSASTANARSNAFACTTCHAERARDAGTRIFPGPPLEGASARPSWWGGNVRDLYSAVDLCFEHFMSGERLDPNGDTAQALLAYLEDLSRTADPATTAAVPFTVPLAANDIAPGDMTRGQDLYNRACFTCHNAPHAMSGRLGTSSQVPDDTLNAHLTDYGPACTRVVFVEKMRHGSFLGLAGFMPPFSREVLSDEQVADILAYIGAPTGGMCMP